MQRDLLSTNDIQLIKQNQLLCTAGHLLYVLFNLGHLIACKYTVDLYFFTVQNAVGPVTRKQLITLLCQLRSWSAPLKVEKHNEGTEDVSGRHYKKLMQAIKLHPSPQSSRWTWFNLLPLFNMNIITMHLNA